MLQGAYSVTQMSRVHIKNEYYEAFTNLKKYMHNRILNQIIGSLNSGVVLEDFLHTQTD